LEDDRQKLLSWLGARVLPHEPEVRAWLRRALNNAADVDDVIQEAYCRMWSMTNLDGIASPRAYFFKVVRNVVIDEMRKARIVRIESVAEIEDLRIASADGTPETIATARSELRRVKHLIDALPVRCRQIFSMRKIEGLSQREIASELGVSENIVENEASRGLKIILKAMEEGDGEPRRLGTAPKHGRRRGQVRDQ